MFIKMLKVALKDGTLTYEELKMLKEVDRHYGHYDKEFNKAVNDGFITNEECKKLRDLRNRIYERAYVKAIEDVVVTEDERAILKEIQEAADMSDEEIRVIEEKAKKGEKIKLNDEECV